MLKKIRTQDLKPGMLIVDSNISWMENPYLYAREGIVATEGEARRICEEGYLEVVIDVSGSLCDCGDELLTSHAFEYIPAFVPLEELASKPCVPFAEELDRAKGIYDSALEYAHQTIDGLRKQGVINVEAAMVFVDEMLRSITRNSNALVGLSKLRSFDEYTYTHCINVGLLSMVFGRHLGLDSAALQRIGIAGMFHDLGKIQVPDAILKLNRKLTQDEFSIVKEHPGLGYSHMLHQAGLPEEVLQGVYEHHEKFNGQGYPRGLHGEEISLTARVLAVVDVYDALTSQRTYKPAMLPHDALALMYGMRARDFHPGLVERFIRCLGIYPVGSVVELNTGQHAVVSENNTDSPLQPRIHVVETSDATPPYPVVDLAAQTEMRIVACHDPSAVHIDPAQVLGMTPTVP